MCHSLVMDFGYFFALKYILVQCIYFAYLVPPLFISININGRNGRSILKCNDGIQKNGSEKDREYTRFAYFPHKISYINFVAMPHHQLKLM